MEVLYLYLNGTQYVWVEMVGKLPICYCVSTFTVYYLLLTRHTVGYTAK